LRKRKRSSLTRSAALLLAGVIFYLPANIFPVMTVIRWGQGAPNTILGGVAELIAYQMWPLAILVFVASVVVPLLKIFGLSAMLIATHMGSARGLIFRSRLYRLIDGVGRWSMIDVFMLTVLVALVRMGFIATVLPGLGATAFATVVLLTMFAAEAFDPRLMWDAASEKFLVDSK
jgi:paraquat-inducible protein A